MCLLLVFMIYALADSLLSIDKLSKSAKSDHLLPNFTYLTNSIWE